MKKLLLLSLISLVPLSSLANAPKDSEIIREARADIDAANKGWFPAMQNHNASAISDAYAEDGVFVAPDGKSIQGRDAIRQMYEERIKKPGKYLSGTVVQDGTRVVDGRIYEWGHAWVNLIDEKGKEAKHGGAYLTVWQKDKKGHWKIVRNLAL